MKLLSVKRSKTAFTDVLHLSALLSCLEARTDITPGLESSRIQHIGNTIAIITSLLMTEINIHSLFIILPLLMNTKTEKYGQKFVILVTKQVSGRRITKVYEDIQLTKQEKYPEHTG